MVPHVVATQDFRIELLPFGVPLRVFALGVKGVTGRSHSDQRPAGCQVLPDPGKISLGQRSTANTQHDQVRCFNRLDSRKPVAILPVSVHERTTKFQLADQFVTRKFRKCLLRLVLTFSDQKPDVGRRS